MRGATPLRSTLTVMYSSACHRSVSRQPVASRYLSRPADPFLSRSVLGSFKYNRSCLTS